MRPTTALFAALAGTALSQKLDVKRYTIEQCLTKLGVPFDVEGSEEWERDVAPFNVRIPYTPRAIAVPTTIPQIRDAVNCGRKLNLKVNPKSGGHSYANLGFGGENGHLIVQLDRMYDVSYDAATQIATVQPGARLGHLATVLYEEHNRAISHGTCPGVGISGHFAHGGFGFSSHMHGLALDAVVGVTVVLADGRIVEASDSKNKDLFWAIKGAGSNFGIVAEWKLKTFEAPQTLTKLSVALNWNKTTGGPGLNALDDYVRHTMPRELNFRVSAYASPVIGLEGLYYGPSDEAVAAIQVLLDAAAPEANITEAAEMNWIEAVEAYSFSDTIDWILPSPQENFYSKSLALQGLNGTSAQNFIDYVFDEASQIFGRFWFFQLDAHGGDHSAISAVPFGDTSYAHRDKLYLIQFYDRLDNNNAEWQEPEWFSFLNDWVDAVTDPLPEGSYGAYVNYVDSNFNRQEAQQMYYGAHLRRLQQLKRKYDPNQLFYYPTSIAPAR